MSLWVTDEGEGVAPEDRARIFDRFARGHGQRQSDGAGLGLAIVAAIVEAHGGYVQLHSVPGEGATFTLILPVERYEPFDAYDIYETEELEL